MDLAFLMESSSIQHTIIFHTSGKHRTNIFFTSSIHLSHLIQICFEVFHNVIRIKNLHSFAEAQEPAEELVADFYFISDWCDAAMNDIAVSAKLIGGSNTIYFDVPKTVVIDAAITFIAYVEAGGMDSMSQIYETPIQNSTISSLSQTQGGLNGNLEYVLDHFSIRLPRNYNVWTVNNYRDGYYEDWAAGHFEDDPGACLYATNYDDLFIKISVDIDVHDMLRTMGKPDSELIDEYTYIMYSDAKKIPKEEKIQVFKTETTNFVGYSYSSNGHIRYMLKYLWAHNGHNYYMSIDVSRIDEKDVSQHDLDTVVGFLESLNTL